LTRGAIHQIKRAYFLGALGLGELGLGGLLPRLPPDGFPVVLGKFGLGFCAICFRDLCMIIFFARVFAKSNGMLFAFDLTLFRSYFQVI